MGKMTEKQRRFADYYIETGNASEAYKMAGYKGKSISTITTNANRLLTNADIEAYIRDIMAKKDKERIASQDEILETLTKVLRGEEEGTELVGVGKGAQRVEQLPPTIEAKIRAGELLGKRYAMWKDNKNIEVSGAVQFIDDIGDEDES